MIATLIERRQEWLSDSNPSPNPALVQLPRTHPHWGRVQQRARQGGRGVGERIISVVQVSPTSPLVATPSGTVNTYNNHQPKRLVAIWQLHPEAGHLYCDAGLIAVRHKEQPATGTCDAEILLSMTLTNFVPCERYAELLLQTGARIAKADIMRRGSGLEPRPGAPRSAAPVLAAVAK